MEKTKTLKLRVKDRHAKKLAGMSKAVNFVWNYINELSNRSIRERGVFLSAFDIHKYTTGAGNELGLHSQTLQMIAKEYVTRRKQFKKSRLNWRSSGGSRRSLGWVPVNGQTIKWKNGAVYHNKTDFKVWDSYGLENYEFRSGSFNEDAQGRWYFNVVVSFEADAGKGKKSIGIDLGLKTAATTSEGDKITGRPYRKYENDLGIAQRAKKKKRVAAIHAKIKNIRKDEQHKFSRKLVNENAAIFVGNVSSKKMIKGRFAKSALDASWGKFKRMLEYKSDHAGIIFEEINEAWTTQTCSDCGTLPDERPKGISGLGISEWTCGNCNSVHDRDINAAINIRERGHALLAVGISSV